MAFHSLPPAGVARQDQLGCPPADVTIGLGNRCSIRLGLLCEATFAGLNVVGVGADSNAADHVINTPSLACRWR